MVFWKKWVAAACSIVLAGGLCACSMVTVNEERDKAQVVAEVNGVALPKSVYYTTMQNVAYTVGATTDELEQSDMYEDYQKSALSQMVTDELVYQDAQEKGVVDFSEEHRAELMKAAQEDLYSMLEYYRDQTAADETIPEDEKETQALIRWGEYRENANMTDLEAYVDRRLKSDAINEMRNSITEPVTFTEEQAKEFYDQQVEMQQPFIEEDETQASLYQAFGELYVNPSGYKYVKHVLLSIPDETQAEISTLRSEGNDEQADAVRDEALAELKSLADEITQRARDGEDFDALIAEYGEDPGMESEPAKTYGYLVYEGNEEYIAEFTEASVALQNVGDISDPVATDFGYHIIKYDRDGKGPVPFETVKDDIMASQLTSAQESAYLTYTQELKDKAAIKEYANRI